MNACPGKEDGERRQSCGTTSASQDYVRRELARVSYTLAKFRSIACLGLIGLASLFVVVDSVNWKAGFLITVGVVIGTLSIYDAIVRRFPAHSTGLIIYHVGTVLAFQTAIIVTTGGIDSPAIMIVLPVALLTSFSLGERRYYLIVASYPVALIWLLTLGKVFGVFRGLVPGFLGGDAAANSSTVYSVVLASILTGIILFGGLAGQFLRGAVDRAAAAAAAARLETVATMRERNRELLSLSGALAHELRNPLASIQGLAGLVGRKIQRPSREAEQMDVLLGEAHRMGAILDEFLNFSRPVQSLAVSTIGAGELLGEVVALHEAAAAERGVTVEVKLEDPEPVFAADARKLKQVLVNLLQNALDASPPGGRVRIGARQRSDGGAVFEIEDDGQGLAEEVRGRLFTPGATTKAAGSGLGLVIARSIVEQHGGELRLEERYEHCGVRAVVVIPASPTVDPTVDREHEQEGGTWP
ncbi:MAG: HAMP domain-containing sensor histidine kinase [Pseudomonadota bacterium]